MSYKTYKISELFDSASGLSKSRDEFGYGYPFLSFKEVFNNYFLPEKLESLANTTEIERERYSILEGDVFITRTSETQNELGLTSVALSDVPNATFNGFTKRLRKKQDTNVELSNKYLGYYFRSPKFRMQVTGFSTMTTRASLNNSMFEQLTIDLPEINIQKTIGAFLFNLDKKIELNNRMNKNLEQMAQAIFKQWFVDFEFPNEQGKPYKSSGGEMVWCEELGKEIPKGWEVCELGNLTSKIIDYRGKTPKKLGYEWSEKGILALSAKNIKNGKLINLDQSNCVDDELYNVWMKDQLEYGDILMTSEAPLGETYFLSSNKKYCLSQRVFALRANTRLILPEVLYYSINSPSVKGDIEGRATGTTVTGIRQSELVKVKILLPNILIQKKYTNIVSNYMIKMNVLDNQTRLLIQSRDTLLPKLMSGEIDVSNIEL